MMRLHIDEGLCTGNGRCYALFPELFIDDDSGYGQTTGDGTVAANHKDDAHRAPCVAPKSHHHRGP